jgi:aminoglycoside 6'-N-acetyltransferase I
VNITIREMTAADAAVWADMRHALWPFTTADENRRDIDNILSSDGTTGFVALDETGAPAGFAEVAVRPYANGCEETPVAFLEGIWVTPAFRRRGIGERMITHIGRFLSAMGYNELCSDALLDNTVSHDAHRSWGFTETERVVYFRKPLP